MRRQRRHHLGVLEVVVHTAGIAESHLSQILAADGCLSGVGVPFFITGLLFSIVFRATRARITQLYGADLLGGSLACLALVPLLNFIGGPNTILFASPRPSV